MTSTVPFCHSSLSIYKDFAAVTVYTYVHIQLQKKTEYVLQQLVRMLVRPTSTWINFSCIREVWGLNLEQGHIDDLRAKLFNISWSNFLRYFDEHNPCSFYAVCNDKYRGGRAFHKCGSLFMYLHFWNAVNPSATLKSLLLLYLLAQTVAVRWNIFGTVTSAPSGYRAYTCLYLSLVCSLICWLHFFLPHTAPHLPALFHHL